MNILEEYNAIYSRIHNIEEEIHQSTAAMEAIEEQSDQTIPGRIDHLKKQIETIDEYQLKIKAFRQLAQQHIQSMNVLTIEAPPNYRVNLNRLRKWAMMIDPLSKDDPYAQKVYLVSKCDEFFLENKRKDFSERIDLLEKEYETKNYEDLQYLKEKIRTLKEELEMAASDSMMLSFGNRVVKENSRYIFDHAKEEYVPLTQASDCFSPGAYGLPLGFPEEQRGFIKDLMGVFYDKNASRVYLPVERIRPDKEFILTVNCIPGKNKVSEMDSGIRNFLINILDQSPAGSRKIQVIDAERQNTKLLGSLRTLQGSYIMENCPRTDEQISSSIENLVSSFSDMDDILDDYDTVTEYNLEHPEQALVRRVVVLVGWPGHFKGSNKELLQRLILNHERYGISLILVNIGVSKTNNGSKDFGLSDYISEGVIHIEMKSSDTTITISGKTYKYAWYLFKQNLSDAYVESIMKYQPDTEALGNEYTHHFDMIRYPDYTRQYKKLELPFGINSKEEIQSLSFENENFAAYLVGASRSGKSTLLHTLIAGLIRNYHPDNLELWLADFKQLEFEKYITYRPPHVKYILLDESQELVFDLIDKLTDKMMQRQHLFARMGKERIDQINPEELKEPLPLIFVILDEFSIMSQALADAQDYRLRLQNLLAKGAALGIRFLFSSQTFTTGIAGLTSTARAQVQQRIAMKASKEEITETLELSSNMKTEQVRNWMDALPPHYALVKCRQGADYTPVVQRSLVMYFEDYTPRNNMITGINNRMKPVDVYDPSDIDTYVDKHPVLVDGRAFQAFDPDKFRREIKTPEGSFGLADEEIYLSLGTPRLMSDTRLITLTQESRENILMISRFSEQACTASVLLSAMQCFCIQNRKIQIWAYGKNKMYRTYRDIFRSCEGSQVRIFEDNDQVCDAIYNLKERIQNKVSDDVLIIMLGMERICGDFEYAGGNSSRTEQFGSFDLAQGMAARDEILAKKGATVQDQKDQERVDLGQALLHIKKEIKAKAKAEGRSPDEIKQMIAEATQEFMKEHGLLPGEKAQQKEDDTKIRDYDTGDHAEAASPDHQSGAYNAAQDFQYVMKYGSRSGYHFLMVLNNLSDLKQTHAKMDYFRHRMGFQVSRDDSRELFAFRNADELPEHVCQYYDTLERFSFRPYLNKGISWDGWFINDDGEVMNPFSFEM